MLSNSVVEFIRLHSELGDPEDTTSWGKIVAALEDCLPSDFDMSDFSQAASLSYTGNNALLQSIAISLTKDVSYQVNDNDSSSIVKTPCINLGFNGSIPEYVKYRRSAGSGWKHIWIPSMKEGILAPIAVNDECYSRTWDSENLVHEYETNGEVVLSKSDDVFYYGNNYVTGSYDARYAVPLSITTSKGTYEFCGYNITLNTAGLLLDTTRSTSDCYTYVYFDKVNNRNRWSAAPIRNFLNSKSGTANAYSCDSDWNGDDYTINSLVSKVASEDGFLKNITKTVNRTWVYGTDTGTSECTSDRFWLLGMGNINCTGKDGDDQYFYDTDKDTSKFSKFGSAIDLYKSNSDRVKYFMTSSGSVGSNADNWWLRSAYSDDSLGVGCIYDDGSVDDLDAYIGGLGVSPACLIG